MKTDQVLTLDDIHSSKIYVKDGGMDYRHPDYYLEPFLKAVDPEKEKYRILVDSPVVNENVGDGFKNIAYGRIMVEAFLGEEIPEFQETLGIVVALDRKEPVMKVYMGQNATACMNLTVFNAEHLFEQSMLTNFQDIYDRVGRFLDNRMQERKKFEQGLDRLMNYKMSHVELNEKVGYLLRAGNMTDLGSTPIVQASRWLDDNKSRYFVGEEGCTGWHLYNTITQSITNSGDFVTRPNKTIKLAQLIIN